MTKINSEDLILFQRGELSEQQMDHIKNELMSNHKLQKELEVLKKADMAMENHFNDFKMPEDFRNKVKKKFKWVPKTKLTQGLKKTIKYYEKK